MQGVIGRGKKAGAPRQKELRLVASGGADWPRGRAMCVEEELGMSMNVCVMVMEFILGTL